MFALAIKNLLRNPLRSGLTILGVAMGIAMLVSVTGYGNSIGTQLHNAVTNRYQLILLSTEVSSPLSSSIAERDLRRLKKIQGVDDAQPIVIGSTRTDRIPYFLVIGVASKLAFTGNLSLFDGRWPDEDRNEIALGHGAAKSFEVAGNGHIDIQQRQYSVTGIFGSESNILNHAGIVDIATAQAILNKRGEVSAVLLRIDSGQGIKSVTRAVAESFPHLQLTKSADLLGRVELFIVIEKVTTTLGLIAVLFCILIVMNTLLMSLAERKREIGILAAIGWSRPMIAGTLLLESLIMSAAGSVVGIFAGAFVLDFYSRSNVPGINWGAPDIPETTVIVALGSAIAIAIMSSVYPMLLSSRLSPSQILQRD